MSDGEFIKRAADTALRASAIRDVVVVLLALQVKESGDADNLIPDFPDGWGR